ncbi:hypothetical protein IL306_009522, partial [Fusarium sp. DS 682]
QSTSEGSCGNCKRQAEARVLSCAQLPLAIHLLQHIRDSVSVHHIEEFGDVEEYLRLYLQWRVVKYGGEVVSEEEFKRKFAKIQISVLCGIGRLSPGNFERTDAAPVSSSYNEYVPLPEITNEEPGGLCLNGSENRKPCISQQEKPMQALLLRLPKRERYVTREGHDVVSLWQIH